jgi:hypothetical protein
MSNEDALAELVFAGGDVDLLPKFDEARLEFKKAFERCDQLGVPDGSATAAAMTELLPHLTAAYGGQRAAFLLRRLAEAVSSNTPSPSLQ